MLGTAPLHAVIVWQLSGGIMESIGASERVMEYLDRETAPQLSKGRILPDFTGKVGTILSKGEYQSGGARAQD